MTDVSMDNEVIPFWQRLVVTIIAMIAVSLAIGFIWRSFFSLALPEYISGVIGGLTAVPLWDFLK